jgi:hypothetical protein
MKPCMTLALLALAGCYRAEFGYADRVQPHGTGDWASDPLDPLRQPRRVMIKLIAYRLPAAQAAGADEALGFEDPNVRVVGREAFALHGMHAFVLRPGSLDLLARRLKGHGAVQTVRGGFVLEEVLTEEIGPRARRSVRLTYPGAEGAASETIEIDGAAVEVEAHPAPGGGSSVRVDPKLRRVGDGISLWGLPALSASTVIDEERALVLVPRRDRADAFGAAFLGTAAGEVIVLAVTCAVR